MNRSSKWFLIIAALAVLAIAFAGCAPAAAPEAAPAGEGAAAEAPAEEGDKTIIVGFYQEPEILNPLIRTQTVADEATNFVIEGLIDADSEGNYRAELAAEVPTIENGQVSEDGLSVTYMLRDDIVWSDGEPLTCDDVLYTWELANNPDSGAVNTTNLTAIASVECPDDYTVVTTYDEFYAPFLSTFTFVIPRHATGEPADMVNWDYNWGGVVGTGPYVLEEWVSGDQMIFVANENYRDYPDKPAVDKVIARIIPSREVGKALITSGEIDVLWDLTEADVPEFEENPDVVVYGKAGLGTERLLINLADPALDATDDPLGNPHPLLGDVRVRQAIQAGIDKQFLVDELLFGQTKVGVSELSLGWSQCDIAPSEYNPEAAMAMLDEAGFTDEDGDGIRECNGCMYAEDGAPLSLKYQTTSGNQLREESQQLILEMMNEIGVEFKIENVPSSELFGSWSAGAFRKHGDFDILMYTTSDGIDPQSQMDGYFHMDKLPTEANGGNGFNYSRWVNEDASAAIEAAGATPDQAARKASYQTACELIDAELPHIYLYDRGEIHLARENVKNFEVNVFQNSITWNTADWDVE